MSKIEFTKYTNLVPILQQTKDKEVENYNTLRKYLEGLSSDYHHFLYFVQKFQCEFLPKSDKNSATPKFAPKYDQEYSSELGKVFKKLASSELMEEEGFTVVMDKIEEDIMPKLDEDLAQYEQSFNNVLKQFKETLEKPKKLIKSYNATHQKYFQAGDKLKEMINGKKSANAIKKAKSEFVSAKKAAIDEYNKLQLAAAEISQELENLLTLFENIEYNRSMNMQQLIKLILDQLVDPFQCTLVEGKSKIIHEIQDANVSNDLSILTNELGTNPPISLAHTPKASDCFQLVRVNPEICLYLKPEQLFPPDFAEGRKVMRAKCDFDGIGEKLKLIKGEYVVILEEIVQGKDRFFKCKNVNESVGCVPMNVLEAL